MQHSIFTTLLVTLFVLLPSTANAFTLSQTTNHGAVSLNAYARQFDILVMDFTVRPTASETLTEVLAFNQGSARAQHDLGRVVLWADEGEGGFKGLGHDRSLGNLAWDESIGYFRLSGLSETLPASGKRFFISVETQSLASQVTVNMMIPKDGLRFTSGSKGPSDADLANPERQTLRTSVFNIFPPKSAVTSLRDREETTPLRGVTIAGVARAQGSATIRSVKVSIRPAGEAPEWKEATLFAPSANSTTWDIAWPEAQAGTYTIQMQAFDGSENVEAAHSITVTVKPQETPAPTTPLPAPSQSTGASSPAQAGSLVRAQNQAAVYYVATNNKRYGFPNEKTYRTWYSDFSAVRIVSVEELARIPLGGVARYRPGARLVKITTDPKVYAVERGGLLRWVKTPELADTIYGRGWTHMVDDIDDALFTLYRIGDPIEHSFQYSQQQVLAAIKTIDEDVR